MGTVEKSIDGIRQGEAWHGIVRLTVSTVTLAKVKPLILVYIYVG